jgi:hypothetical protein
MIMFAAVAVRPLDVANVFDQQTTVAFSLVSQHCF